MYHASSSKICKHDVFFSFRGEDTRRTFVSHFFNALKQRGIHAFKDDERLETGKSISGELLKTIEESRFAIIVIPVFYDVSPSNVCHQNAPFAKSFSKHEKNYKDDLEKVQRWRDAFSEAQKISGYHLQNFKDEAYGIKKLVDDIFPKSLQVISPFPESLVGMKSLVEKVTSLLDRESNDVYSIGIWDQWTDMSSRSLHLQALGHAFREKSPEKYFMEPSREVVNYAGRLPLALKVLGSIYIE
ncbi:disease resistance protein Roq1-like [Lycium barbarum]|uniref:disease resistance protein Roq1-like n=1 Tax=Lycium barbarum TaxID=112863 RepID=UPI00293F65C6|nr:disease resistance protein Roq1-like [Lycium barbarum]